MLLAVAWAGIAAAVPAQLPAGPTNAATATAAATVGSTPFGVATPRIGVVTMEPGNEFWERFGHDAIVVEDGDAVSYNFGFFDLAEDGFIGRFVRGEMQYRLVALPLADDRQYYRDVGRGATLQWLDLQPAQARRLATDLAENARPENARQKPK